MPQAAITPEHKAVLSRFRAPLAFKFVPGTADNSDMPDAPRTAADILADLQALDRENDRLEHRLALVAQSLKAAQARDASPDALLPYLQRAEAQLRHAS